MAEGFDVFLSYNGRDRALVEPLATALRDRGVSVFLDRWYLMPGRPWPRALEDALSACRAVAVVLGPSGMGRWQQREKDLALDRQAQAPETCVVPVLLPGSEPALGFLSLNTWVDLRSNAGDPIVLDALAEAIRGRPPGPELRARLQATVAAICPYRALRPFREEDAALFFGREAFTEQLASAVGKQSFVAVVGASGSGKSSVVRAGLVPALRRSTSPVWEVATVVVGDRPLRSLAAALVPLLESEMSETDRLVEVGKLATRLLGGELSLRDVVTRALEKQRGTDRLLLVLDQWEELYTLGTDDVTRRRFVDEILDATRTAPLTAVLTLRGDFFGHALAHRPLADRLQGAVVNLGPLTRDELVRTVEVPAQRVGLLLEPGLTSRILDDVGDEPGNLPLMEFALAELWQHRRGTQLTFAAYEAMGGIQGAIARRAEDVLGSKSVAEQSLARRVFSRLVRPGDGTADTRQRAKLGEIEKLGGAALALVRSLADARLLVTARDRALGEETVEIAHEALIRHWKRLRGWIDEDRELLLWLQRLESVRASWEHAGRGSDALLRGTPLAEAERWADARADDLTPAQVELVRESAAQRDREDAAARRRRRTAYALLASGLVAVTVLAGLAGWALLDAHAKARVAESRRLAALATSKLGEGEMATALLLGVEAYRAHPTSEARDCLTAGLERCRSIDTVLRGPFIASPQSSLPHGQRVAFSHDGRSLAVGDDDATVSVWDVATRTLRVALPPDGAGATLHVFFSADDKTLLATHNGHGVRRWDVPSLAALPALTGPYALICAAMSSDGTSLSAVSRNEGVLTWDLAGETNTPRFRASPISLPFPLPLTAAFTSDARLVALSGLVSVRPEVMRLDDAPSPIFAGLRDARAGITTSLALARDGTVLAAGDENGDVILSATDEPEATTFHVGGRVTSLAFDDATMLLGCGTEEGGLSLHLLDAKSHALLLTTTMPGHRASVDGIAFSPDGTLLASHDASGALVLFNVAKGRVVGRDVGDVTAAALSHDGSRVAVADDASGLALWDVSQRRPARRILDPGDGRVLDVFTNLTFSSDGRTLASTMGTDVVLWDVASGVRRRTLVRAPETVVHVAYSADGRVLVTSMRDKVLLWEADSGAPRDELDVGFVQSLAVSPDASLVATSGVYRAALWSVAERSRLWGVAPDTDAATDALTFSPDGRALLVHSGRAGRVYDVASLRGREIRDVAVRGDRDDARADSIAAITGDGRQVPLFIHYGGSDETIWFESQQLVLFDAATGVATQYLAPGPGVTLLAATITPSGRAVAVAVSAADHDVLLYELQALPPRARACQVAARNFTVAELEALFDGDSDRAPTCPGLPFPTDAPVTPQRPD